jgi:hypothetical protein
MDYLEQFELLIFPIFLDVIGLIFQDEFYFPLRIEVILVVLTTKSCGQILKHFMSLIEL